MATTPTTGVGIFGPTRSDLRQQYLKNLQGQFASAQSPYEKMGLALGNIVGTAFGIRDPQLEQASKIESIYQSVAQMHPDDQTTPEFYRELASVFSAAGMQEQALMSAEQSRKVEDQRIDRQYKLAQMSETIAKKQRDTVDYYKKNPEQAEFRLTQLAEIIKNDPSNTAAVQEYEKITRSASEGAIEASAKAEKETLELESSKVNLQKARQDLQKANTNAQAAIDFFKAYGLDPAKGLDDQPNFKKIPASIRASAGFMPALFDAQQKALTLLKPTTAPSGAPAAGASRANDPLGIRPR